MLTKKTQLKKNKPIKDLTESEKTKYFTWIKDNKCCVICGKFPLIHHITDKSIAGERRLHTRVYPLCHDHHSAQSSILSIHNNKERFYKEIKSLKDMLKESKELYKEFGEYYGNI